jgi:HTH-type transcriptional regulator, sugar sensing transcriptional regulator
MNKEVLRKIGLTEGEIRVYYAVVKIGESSTGKIMEQCGISSSKVYLILDKLIRKGLVTFVIQNNVKRFKASNPASIIEYIDKQQEELEKTKNEAKRTVKEIQSLIGSYTEETAQVYVGTKSMLSAFSNILDELKKGEEFLFIGAPAGDVDNLRLFFQNLHAKRINRKIKTKGIVNTTTKKKYDDMFKGMKNIELRYSSLNFPHAVGIGNTRVILSLWGDNPIAFEIVSERMVKKYKDFFKSQWELAKK